MTDKPLEAPAMRRPRARITVRMLMIAVALIGLTLFGSITAMRMSRRAKVYRFQATTWRLVETDSRKHLALCRKEIEGFARAVARLRERRHKMYQPEELAERSADQAIWWRANAAHTEEMIAYSSMMRRKYDRAARYPWLAIAPDPPVPYWSGVADSPLNEPAEALGQDHDEPDVGGSAKPTGIIVDRPEAGVRSRPTP